jgi:hypothetical protein
MKESKSMYPNLIKLTILALAVLVLSAYSCNGPSLPPTTSGGGFFIETEFQSSTGPIFPISVPFVTTGWTWKKDVPGFTAVGDARSFEITTGVTAIALSENGRVPALWDVQWLAGGPPECIGAPDDPALGEFQSDPGRTTEVICFEQTGTSSAAIQGSQDFTFSPSPIYTDGSSGNIATISGKGFSSQFGFPLLQYYDMSGNLVQQANATSVAPDGTWINAPIPDISQVQVGAYVGFVYNPNSSGSYTYIGTTSVIVLNPLPPPPDGGGCGGTGGIGNTCN